MTVRSTTHLHASARRRVRLTAGAVCGVMTVIYLWMFFAIRWQCEQIAKQANIFQCPSLAQLDRSKHSLSPLAMA